MFWPVKFSRRNGILNLGSKTIESEYIFFLTFFSPSRNSSWTHRHLGSRLWPTCLNTNACGSVVWSPDGNRMTLETFPSVCSSAFNSVYWKSEGHALSTLSEMLVRRNSYSTQRSMIFLLRKARDFIDDRFWELN